tara:strand:- start:355 stop:516 length:162 start_codon:yes stop_codon:yes gene_type:complete
MARKKQTTKAKQSTLGVVNVGAELLSKMRQIKEKTGVPISRQASEAISKHLAA